MKRRILIAVLLLAGIGGFVAIPMIVGFEKTVAVIAAVGWDGVAVYLANASLTLLIPAIGWWILLRGYGVKCSPGLLIRANLLGFPLNFFTPSMYLGGEPAKTFYVGAKLGVPKRIVLASIIAAKFQEFVGLILVSVVCVWLVTWRREALSARTEEALIGVSVLSVAGLALLLWAILGRWHLSVRILELLARFGILKKRLEVLRGKAVEMEGYIREAFTARVGTFLLAQAVTALSAASIFARPWIFHIYTGEPGALKAQPMAMCYLITNFLNSIQFIPGGLGMLEGGVVGYFAALGDPAMPEHSAAAFMVINRISDLALLVVGLALLAHAGLMRRGGQSRPAPGV